ncbi:hypothetical protein D3C85_1447950 [compost metagenome]
MHVHPHGTDLELMNHPHGFAEVVRPDTRTEPVGAVVHQAHQLFLIVVRQEGRYRAESFFLEQGRVRRSGEDDSGLDVTSWPIDYPPTIDDLVSLAAGHLEVAS